MRKMSHVCMAGVASMAIPLIFAATTMAAGPTPGPIILDIKCYNASTNSYCGSYSVDAKIKDNGNINLPNCNRLKRKCTEYYPDKCPEGSVRTQWKYSQGTNIWAKQCNP